MVGSAQESRKTHREHLGLLKNYFAWLQATMNLVHQKGTQRLQLKKPWWANNYTKQNPRVWSRYITQSKSNKPQVEKKIRF